MIDSRDPNNNYRFIYDEKGNPVPEPDLMKWAEWFEKAGGTRVIKQEDVGNYQVSTVFLALDYSFVPGGRPLLFETMIFEKELTEVDFLGKKMKVHKDLDYQERCSTKLEAIAQHKKAVAWLKRQKLS